MSRPWAAAVLLGGKTVENRTWSTDRRGWLVLHAAQSIDRDAEAYIASRGDWLPQLLATRTWRRVAAETGYLGAAELLGVHRDGDDVCRAYASGARRCAWGAQSCWHWELGEPVLLPTPIPGPGRTGLWRPPSEVAAAVAARLAARPATALRAPR
jgi:hypothetical protein